MCDRVVTGWDGWSRWDAKKSSFRARVTQCSGLGSFQLFQLTLLRNSGSHGTPGHYSKPHHHKIDSAPLEIHI